jgi:succinate dehydrogenase/fumarate reductase cytochrome b subunit
MTLLSLGLITLWMALVVLGVTFAGFVHALIGAAVAIVLMSGKRGSRRARAAAAAAAAATVVTTATGSGMPMH